MLKKIPLHNNENTIHNRKTNPNNRENTTHEIDKENTCTASAAPQRAPFCIVFALAPYPICYWEMLVYRKFVRNKSICDNFHCFWRKALAPLSQRVPQWRCTRAESFERRARRSGRPGPAWFSKSSLDTKAFGMGACKNTTNNKENTTHHRENTSHKERNTTHNKENATYAKENTTP